MDEGDEAEKNVHRETIGANLAHRINSLLQTTGTAGIAGGCLRGGATRRTSQRRQVRGRYL
jgi:hypothetical protein